MAIRALFFDLDDTLLETHFAHRKALRTCCEQVSAAHPHWSVDALAAVFHRVYVAVERDVEFGAVQFDTQGMFRLRVWRDTLEECRLPLALGEELAHRYQQRRRELYELFPDAPPALDRYAGRYRLALVTNGLSDVQRDKVVATGLERWFPHVLVSGEIGAWKPRPEIFHAALDAAGVGADEAVMVGDSLSRDVVGARAVGLRAVWLRRHDRIPSAPVSPDAEIATLDELDPLLARWA